VREQVACVHEEISYVSPCFSVRIGLTSVNISLSYIEDILVNISQYIYESTFFCCV